MKTAILLLFVVSISLAQSEDNIYQNYLVAARNNSTFQYNLVIKFKNLITHEEREICVEGEQLIFAIYEENNLEYDAGKNYDKVDKIISENKSRYFKFKNPKAIERIIGKSYSEEELKKLKKKINFDKLAKQAKSVKNWQKSFDSEKIMFMYAHELFNRGILTGQNGCIGDGTLRKIDINNQY